MIDVGGFFFVKVWPLVRARFEKRMRRSWLIREESWRLRNGLWMMLLPRTEF